MPEFKQTMIPVEVTYICDECQEGMMQNHSMQALMVFPPKFILTCENCGATMTSMKNYPVIEYIKQEVK